MSGFTQWLALLSQRTRTIRVTVLIGQIRAKETKGQQRTERS